MVRVDLPSYVSYEILLSRLKKANSKKSSWSEMVINFPYNCFINTAAIATLVSWLMQHVANGKKVSFVGDHNVLNYLSRMDVFVVLNIDFTEHYNRRVEAGRFIPVKLIDDDDSVFHATNEICELIMRQFDNSRKILPAIEWCVNEVIDNVRIHSSSEAPGIVCAQYYPNKQTIELAIVDNGRGIKDTLLEYMELQDDVEAITNALRRGVTRNKNIGQGNGLAGTVEIVKCNRGLLDVWSGLASYQQNVDCSTNIKKITKHEGTGVFIRMDTNNAVNLEDTFIGNSGWSYLNYKSEQVEEEGIKVKDECLHTGGRSPAAALRRKIEAIMPECREKITLDFSNIESASSSFMDELLGRLAEEYGVEVFEKIIYISNLSTQLKSIANVVIHQRISSK